MGDGPGAWALCPTQPLNSAQVPGPRTCWGDPMEGTGSGLQALLGGGSHPCISSAGSSGEGAKERNPGGWPTPGVGWAVTPAGPTAHSLARGWLCSRARMSRSAFSR